ncbi:MAG: hypothetical protein ACPGLV_15460 [Bacteroidia bacterium]
MKKALILFLILSTSSILNAQSYPESATEVGFNFGVLNRYHSNMDQGRDEDGYPAYRFGTIVQQRYNVFILSQNLSIEHGGVYDETYFNVGGGSGLAILNKRDFRIDVLLGCGVDLSPQIPAPWFRPTLSGELSAYYKNFRISLASRAALGIIEGYAETGITIGYLLRQGI